MVRLGVVAGLNTIAPQNHLRQNPVHPMKTITRSQSWPLPRVFTRLLVATLWSLPGLARAQFSGGFGDLPGGAFLSQAFGVSNGGTVVVTSAHGNDQLGPTAS